MPFSNINTTLSGAQLAAIDTAITNLLAALPVKYNLTKDERVKLPNISSERYPYVKRGIEIHGPNNPTLVTGFAGTQAEASNDLVFFDQHEAIKQKLLKVLEIVTDTQQVAGSEAYRWLRLLYTTAQTAAANQVPGADSVVDDLAPLFDKESNGGTSPINP
jgi:hypothetical protein